MRARRRVPICAPFLRVNGQSARIGARDLLFWQVNTRSLRATRPLICPFTPKAGENGDPKTRDSLTPFEMTLCKWFEYTEKFKLYQYLLFRVKRLHTPGMARISTVKCS